LPQESAVEKKILIIEKAGRNTPARMGYIAS